MFVTGIVLAAGGSRRLGRPKQLLPYRGSTLLDSVLRTARGGVFDQLLLTIGGAATDVEQQVDLSGFEIISNPGFETGCGSSISTAVGHVDQRSDGVVLLLGDQPGVTAASIAELVAQAGDAPIGIIRYRDGLGHPFWLGRTLFAELATLHGDKAVWKMVHSGRFRVTEVPVDSELPLDVDTWDDYQALIAAGS